MLVLDNWSFHCYTSCMELNLNAMVKVYGVMLNCLKNQWQDWELKMLNSFIGSFLILLLFFLLFFYSFTDKIAWIILINRLVRAHWNPSRLEAIKTAYKQRYGKTLEARVKGETSGDYQKLLVAIIKSSEKV